MTNLAISTSDYAYSIIPCNNSQGLRPKKLKEDDRINNLYRELKHVKKDCINQLPDAMQKSSAEFVVDTVLNGLRKGLPFESGCASLIDFMDNNAFQHLSAIYAEYLKNTPLYKECEQADHRYISIKNDFEKAYRQLGFFVFEKLDNARKAHLDIDGLKNLIIKEKDDPHFRKMPVEQRPQFRRYLETYEKCFDGDNNISKASQKRIKWIQLFKRVHDHPEQFVSLIEHEQRNTERESYFKKIKADVQHHFSAIADQLNTKTAIKKDRKLVQKVLKEQKRHTFGRFEMLPYFYHSFCHTVNTVASFLNCQEPTLGEKFLESVKELISNQMTNTKKGKSDYRDQKYMCIQNKDAAAVSEYAHAMNRAMRIIADDKLVTRELARAHTMPFPGAFSWTNIETVEQGKGVSKVSDPISVVVEKNLFLDFKNRQISQMDLETHVLAQMNQMGSSLNNKDEWLHFAILWIKEFYLCLFSETELLPDWINNYPDKVSEWEENNKKKRNQPANSNQEEKTYKKALGNLLLTLLDRRKQKKDLSLDEVVDLLNAEYVPQVFTKLHHFIKTFSSEKASELVLKAALAQVHQSLIYSFDPPNSHGELLKDYPVL